MGSVRQLSGWRCQKKVKTSWPFRTTTSSCQPLTSSTPTSRLSPPKLKDLISTPQRATLRGHNTTSLVVIATWWCSVMARQPPVEHRGPNAAEHFLESLQEERKIKGVLADSKAMRMTRGTGVPSAPLRRATYVTNASRATPCVTTATLQVNIEGRHITPATSSYG